MTVICVIYSCAGCGGRLHGGHDAVLCDYPATPSTAAQVPDEARCSKRMHRRCARRIGPNVDWCRGHGEPPK